MENIQFEYETTSLVWDREVPVSVDSYDNEEETKKLVAEKLHWLNENKAKILEAFMEENDHYVEVINEMIEKGEFKSEAITSEDLKKCSVCVLCFYHCDGRRYWFLDGFKS